MFPFNDPLSDNYQTHHQNLFASQISNLKPNTDFDANKIKTTHKKMVSNSENGERKIIHRDQERQRRKQMTSHLTNLRSLLPIELIKGKRTRADIVDEAVNYIEDLKGKINELHVKRDEELKRLHLEYYSSSSHNQSSNLCLTSCVVINPYSGGLEILIRSCFREQNLQLSRVMRVLFEQSIEVQSCASTRVNERILHTIQTKVDDSRRIDVHELQQKLYQVCNSGS